MSARTFGSDVEIGKPEVLDLTKSIPKLVYLLKNQRRIEI